MKNEKVKALLLSLLGIAIISVIIFISLPKEDVAKDRTEITNFNTVIKNVPKEVKEGVERSLFAIINKNNDSVNAALVRDVIIRKDTATSDNKNNVHYSGKFTVDTASLRQSYELSYRFSKENDGFDSGYPFTATCLPIENLIYGEFDCQELQYAQVVDDEKLQQLPHKAPNYTISARGENGIVIQVMLTRTPSTEKFFKEYITEAKQWLVTNNFNLDDYTLEYRDISNIIVTINDV